MAPDPWIRVEGAGPPRAVGAAQGRAWRLTRPVRDEALLDAAGRAARWVLRWGGRSLSSSLSWEQRRALARDLRRHFPHFVERANALAGAAGCGPVWDTCADPKSRAFSLALAPNPERGLRCVLPAPRRWVLRDIRSDGGYRTCGVGVPWLPATLAGVNEAGLCGAVVVQSPLFPLGDQSAAAVPAVTAPGWLLLDQCLERCERVERAVAWCTRRPGGGVAQLFFADARGQSATISIAGTARRAGAPAPGPASPTVGPVLDLRLDPTARTLALRGPCEDAVVVQSCVGEAPD